MKLIRLIVVALTFTASLAVPAIASAAATPSHFVLRQQNMFTEFYWKADPTTTCGPEAHVVGFGGFQTSQQSGGGAPVTSPLAQLFIEYFDPCTGASEFINAYNDQQANLTFRGLSGSETATVYPFVCGDNGCAQDFTNPIGVNLSVRGTSTTHDSVTSHYHSSYYQLIFEFSGVAHYGPVSGSVTFTTSSGDVLTVFPNYTDPARPLITGGGAGGQVGNSQQTDLYLTFGN